MKASAGVWVFFRTLLFFLVLQSFTRLLPAEAAWVHKPVLSAQSAVVMDLKNGGILYGKNPHLRLPPASTAKLMTALVVLENIPADTRVAVSRNAAQMARSVAGLTPGATYLVQDLVIAALVSSSNDAAVALAEAVSGNERDFAILMNRKAAQLGMRDTHFVNATGLPDKRERQYSTAYDLSLLMRRAIRDRRIDQTLAITTYFIRGSDQKDIFIKNHNKMLWRSPYFVKGKTGWTYASRHTFVGTDYSQEKKIAFALLSSTEPWPDIQKLATFGLLLKRRE